MDVWNPAVHYVQAEATAILSGMTSSCVSHLNILTCRHIFLPYRQILGSESFTRWLVWGTSTSELEKIGKFLHPHYLRVHKFQFFTT